MWQDRNAAVTGWQCKLAVCPAASPSGALGNSQLQPQLWRPHSSTAAAQLDLQRPSVRLDAMALRQLAARWAGSGAQGWLRPFSSAAPSVFDKL